MIYADVLMSKVDYYRGKYKDLLSFSPDDLEAAGLRKMCYGKCSAYEEVLTEIIHTLNECEG